MGWIERWVGLRGGLDGGVDKVERWVGLKGGLGGGVG